MKAQERLEELKTEILGNNYIINSVEEADILHVNLITLKEALICEDIMNFMPHYRGEQFYGWDIKPGLFRPPLKIPDANTAKSLEVMACNEFEESVIRSGNHQLREINYQEKYGKEWDVLFQAQHAGVKTSITDWTAIISSALYFAVEESSNGDIEQGDGQLWVMLAPTNYILSHTQENEKRNLYNQNPFTIDQFYIINPSIYLDQIDNRLYEKRMNRQRGRFFITPARKCDTAINHNDSLQKFLLRFRIPAKSKKAIRQALAERQLTREFVYVEESDDIERIAKGVNEKVFKDYYVTKPRM